MTCALAVPKNSAGVRDVHGSLPRPLRCGVTQKKQDGAHPGSCCDAAAVGWWLLAAGCWMLCCRKKQRAAATPTAPRVHAAVPAAQGGKAGWGPGHAQGGFRGGGWRGGTSENANSKISCSW